MKHFNKFILVWMLCHSTLELRKNLTRLSRAWLIIKIFSHDVGTDKKHNESNSVMDIKDFASDVQNKEKPNMPRKIIHMESAIDPAKITSLVGLLIFCLYIFLITFFVALVLASCSGCIKFIELLNENRSTLRSPLI